MRTASSTTSLFTRKGASLLLFIALLFPLHITAQVSDPFGLDKHQFGRVEQVAGLEDRTVTCIVQDDYGFMWFGTLAGLVRFDGHEIRRYENDASKENTLASNAIRALAKDKHGNLWIATQGGGLDKFEIATERFTHHKHDPSDSASISSNVVSTLLVDSRGLIWAGTFSKGLNVLDPSGKKFRRIKDQRNFEIRAITEDHSGLIWFCTDGIQQVNPTDFKVTTFPSPRTRAGTRTVFQDRHGKFWVAADDEQGVFHFRLANGKYERLSLYDAPFSVNAFCEDKSERIWVATNKGIAVIEDNRVSHYTANPSDGTAWNKKVALALYCDKEGTIWVGCEGGGVTKFHIGKKFFTFRYAEPEDFSNHHTLRSVFEDNKGKIWIGWMEGGIDIFDPRANTLTAFSDKEINNVSSIFQDYDNSFWIGTWGDGLFHYSPDLKTARHYRNQKDLSVLPDNRVQAMLRDRNGVLWTGTENGLAQWDEKRDLWMTVKKPDFPFDLLGSNIQSLAMVEGPDGTIWAGTWLGLNAISPDRKSAKYYAPDQTGRGASDFHVISLELDRNQDVLWIGTFESGLSRLNLVNGEITQITDEQGLASNTIFGIKQDDSGHLWLSTGNGLSKYNPATGHCRNYDAADGLQGNEFFWGVALRTRDEKMLFGGVNGLSMFKPSEIIDQLTSPSVVITDFQIFNKSVGVRDADSLLRQWLPETKAITLSPDQSVFTFEFAALNYVRPEKNLYAYMLDGFDRDWNYLGNKRSATYTNIDPGTYVFRVKASNGDGLWTESGPAITVTIQPPYYLTWWFRSLFFVFVVGSLLAFYFVRIGIANRHRTVLEAKVSQRTREIADKNREILTQMEKVKQLSEELAEQRDNIEQQNSLLASSKAELEKKVKERTVELSLSNNELMRQNVQLEQFAFMTAHNLRSPVARLLGLTAIFNNENPKDPFNVEVVKRIQRSATGLDEVIRDIADILQVQKGTNERKDALLVYPAMERALQLLGADINDQKIEIINKIDPQTAIQGVPTYVNSVFYNIISNAVKYADLRKKPLIELASAQSNGDVTITVIDNGIGFDRERLQEKLFKPFSRLNSHGDGKGLGLYLVKLEMEAMNGEVAIDSKVDQGTVVRLKFQGHS